MTESESPATHLSVDEDEGEVESGPSEWSSASRATILPQSFGLSFAAYSQRTTLAVR